MISEKLQLNIYITPTKDINPKASQIHGLTKSHKNLYKNGNEVNTISLKSALEQVLLYLKKLKRNVY